MSSSKKTWTRRFVDYTYDKHFFESQNLLSSYWAGFIAADGNIYKDDANRCRLFIQLNEKDESHLTTLSENLKFTGEIKKRESSGYSQHKEDDFHCYLSISSAWELAEGLEDNFNVTTQKTHTLEPPDISDENSLAYIIGYIDGDGSIFQRGTGSPLTFINILGTIPILEWIREHFCRLSPPSEKKRGAKVPNKIVKTKGVYQYTISGVRALKVIRTLREVDVPKLDRKWNQPWLLEIL